MNVRGLARSVALLALAASVLFVPRPGRSDDRDMLKFKSAKPYLFILLDTSASMNLRFGADAPVPGHGDDPDSRIWGAKEALFQVFRDVEDVHFGFAAMNQDALRVQTYHWLYYLESVPAGWPLQGSSAAVVWPKTDPDGLTADFITVDLDGNGTPDVGDGIADSDIEGDAVVFGETFTNSAGAPLDAGTCASPLALDTDLGRQRVNAFAKTGGSGTETTTIWLQAGKGGAAKIYRLEVERPGNRPDGTTNSALGSDNLHIQFKLSGPVASCSSIPAATTYNFAFRSDPNLNRIVMVDRGVASASSEEQTAGLWAWSDANDSMTCGDNHPHTGQGWEGNYDSGVQPPAGGVSDVDEFCADADGDGIQACIELRPVDQTVLSEYGRPMDRGDVIPFDWRDGGDNRDLLLQRLAPNWPDEEPNFGVAKHLSSALDPSTGSLVARFPGRPPMVARNDTPFNKSINDARCWYLGKKGRNANGKCGQSPYFSEDGWSTAACVNDPDYGCRRPFLIVIGDGQDVCRGNDATSDVSDLSEFSGMKTWGLNLGHPNGCKSGGGMHSIVTPGDGECVNVANKEDLKKVLAGLLAEIREQARSFATAAVPSVQATSDQAIYVSSFTPLNLKSVWDGHLSAFLKPMPVDDGGAPDVAHSCGSGVQSGCHLWDAGTAIESQFNASDPLGDLTNQRRVSYSLGQTGGTVPRTTRLFDPINCAGSPPSQACTDLLLGLDIPFDVSSPSLMTAAQNAANGVISQTLAKKSHVLKNLDGTNGETIQYLMGDLFHSNPVVVGAPPNTAYWVGDLQSDGTECTDDETGNPGYRCYFRRQRFRRKVILGGVNDGMLHAIEAGRFRESGTDPETGRTLDHEYNNGTGHELFAYIPRTVLETVRAQAQGTAHKFGVDGTPVVADAFIDPAHNGTPVPAERRWRTVVVGGLREGGSAYYALDVTQPDQLKSSDEMGGPIPDDNGATDWVPSCMTDWSASECGPNRYPAVLWEFTDSTDDQRTMGSLPSSPLSMDEDGNLVPDLGSTWSTPNLGRVRLCQLGGSRCASSPVEPEDDDDVIEAYVAIFGGGLDPDVADKSRPERGDWVYMVDVETGKVLYKRQLCSPYVTTSCVTAGGMASEPAAVDTDLDGFLDRLYVQTTGGFLFRIDLGPSSSGSYAPLGPEMATARDAATGTLVDVVVVRVPKENFDTGERFWEPRAIFDANWNTDGSTGAVTASPSRRQFYHRPSVFFAALLDRFGLALGTGNREDLWAKTFQEARFYVFIDDTDELDPASLPLNEGDLRRVQVEDPDLSSDLFLTRGPGQKGWFLELDEEERIITDSFALSGLTIFSSFKPSIAVTDDPCDPLTDPNCNVLETVSCGDKTFEADTDNLCARTGISRNFVVGTTNAQAFLFTVDGEPTRYKAVSAFVTSPYTEPGQNKNSDGDSSTSSTDTLTALEVDVMDNLKQLFPENCKFANYRVDIKTIAADTRVERIAPIPVCVVEKNWKEY